MRELRKNSRNSRMGEIGNFLLRFKIRIILIIIFTLAGLAVGFVLGYGNAIDLCVKAAARIIDFDIDPSLLEDIIIRYGGR